MSKGTKSKPITREKVSAGRQQYNKAIELPDAALGAGVSAPKRDGTGDVNAEPLCQLKGERMSKEAPPQDSQPADKCPEVEIITEVEREKHALAMADVELCDFITKRLSPARKILRDSIPYLQEARKRFSQPGQRVPVAGKPTWGNWIKQNLGFSDRHVRRLLAGEQDQQKSRTKKPVRRAARTSAIAKGDAEALASLWQQALGSLTQTQRRDVLARFFELIPEEQIPEIEAAIEAGKERRIPPGSEIGAEEMSRSEPQKLDAPVSLHSAAQEAGPMPGKVGTRARKGSPEKAKRKTAKKSQLRTKTPKVKVCPPTLSPEAEEHIHWMETAAPAQPGARQGDYVLNELGRWEFDPEVSREGMHETMNAPQAAVYTGSTTQPAPHCTT